MHFNARVILTVLQLAFGSTADVKRRFDHCSTNDGKPGLCRHLPECPEKNSNFRLDLRLGNVDSNNGGGRERCGNALVCCEFKGLTFPGIESTTLKNTRKGGGLPVAPVIATPEPSVPVTPTVGPVRIVDSTFDITNPLPAYECGFRHEGWNSLILPFYETDSAEEVPVFAAVGGKDAGVNTWPWTALLGYPSSSGAVDWLCDGSLINERWILTAAHCFDGGVPVVVRLGEHDYSNDTDGANHEDFGIDSIIPYPENQPGVAYHDLALIKLDRKVTLNHSNYEIYPVCLPWDDEINAVLPGREVALTGWGATEFGGDLSSVLQEVPLTIFESSVCNDSYSLIDDFQFLFPSGISNEDFVCAGDENGGKDACHGDSGGPIVYKTFTGHFLTGIVSKGYGCGLKDFPGLYTPVHKAEYLHWIKQTAFV